MRRPRRADLRNAARLLASEERGVLVLGVIDGVVVEWNLRRHGAKGLVAVRPDLGVDAQRVRRICQIVDVALSLLPWHATCLRRSMTQLRVLARRGYQAELKVGVKPSVGGVAAHAWLEVNNWVVNDDPSVKETYNVFDGELSMLEALA